MLQMPKSLEMSEDFANKILVLLCFFVLGWMILKFAPTMIKTFAP